MPTILRLNGFRLFFYSNEGGKIPHVHVEYQSSVAKFWINPVDLSGNFGMNASELSKAFELVSKHEKQILEEWNAFFSHKK